MSNEKRLSVRHHIWGKLSKMTNDERRSLALKINDYSNIQDEIVWELVKEAEHRAEHDLLKKLTDRLVRLSDICEEDREGGMYGEKSEGEGGLFSITEIALRLH